MPHLFIDNDFFGMIYEHLCDCFHLKDFIGDFLELFELCFNIARSHFCHQITHVLGALCILVMPILPFDKVYVLSW